MADIDIRVLLKTIGNVTGLNAVIRGLGHLGTGVKAAAAGMARLGRAAGAAFGGIRSGVRAVTPHLLPMAAAVAGAIREFTMFNIPMARAWTMAKWTAAEFAGMRRQVLGLSADLGIAKTELAGGLYQALSAGVPSDNILDFLHTAGQVAVADGSDVSTAIDGITTVLNAFKMPATEAAKVADLMFKTVANGKTTFGELASNISSAAPVAASMGVSIEQVVAAVATLTKQGVPTAVAMTQIRAALLSTNDVLGDGWAKTMSMQEAFGKLTEMAGGSQNKLRELVGRVEALQGVLALTGTNTANAAADLNAMSGSAGALGEAFDKMDQVREWPKFWESIRASVTEIGRVFNDTLKPIVDSVTKKLNTWRENTDVFDKLEAKLAKLREDALDIWSAVTEGGEGANLWEGVKDMLVGGLRVGAEKAITSLLKAAPFIGDLLGEAAKKAFSGSRGGEMSVAVDQLRQEGMLGKQGRDKGITRAEQRRLIEERTNQIHQSNVEAAGEQAAARASSMFDMSGAQQFNSGRETVRGVVNKGAEIRSGRAERRQAVSDALLGAKEKLASVEETMAAAKARRDAAEQNAATEVGQAASADAAMASAPTGRGLSGGAYIEAIRNRKTLAETQQKERDEATRAMEEAALTSREISGLMSSFLGEQKRLRQQVAQLEAQLKSLPL